MTWSLPSAALLTYLIGQFVFFMPATAEDKHHVTEPLDAFSNPLGISLDVDSFNPFKGERKIGELLPLFDQFREAQGISTEWTQENLRLLYQLIQRDYSLATARENALDDRYDDLKERIEKLEEDLEDEEPDADLSTYLRLKSEAAPIKKERNLLRGYIDIEKPVLGKLRKALAYPANDRLRYEACDVAMCSLYSLFGNQFIDGREGIALPMDFHFKLQAARHFLDRANLNSTPFISHVSRGKRPVGPRADKECRNLIDPENPAQFLSPVKLAKMSHEAVARLDVSPDNPWWHTRATMEQRAPDTWREIERWLSAKVSEELLGKKKFRKEFPDFSYDLTAAREILFWNDLKTTASSPKINTVDVFDQEWKLKWGEECAVEPIANRLRLKLGARFSDLTYADARGSSHLLILPSPLERSMNPDKPMPTTKSELIDAMLNSVYQFNMEPFILSHGTITEANADTILSGLPKETPKKYRPKKLIGRTWLRFHESMVEAKHDAFTAAGPVALHDEFALHDRGSRQSMIFTFWMDDVDVKEDNHRSIWINDFGGRGQPQFFQYFHDPGSSLGGMSRAGEVNKLSTKMGTGQFLWLNSPGTSLLSNAFQIYRPSYFDHVTFADHFAGALHLVRITRNDIREAVRHSLMPDFYQDCMTWRLTKRRDLIAKVYRLPLPDGSAGPAPNYSIPLTTRANRQSAAAHYQIPLTEIESDLVRTMNLPANNPAANTFEPFQDHLVKDGVIQPYHDTVLLGIIRDYRHPSGFVRRISRFNDAVDWESQRFKLKTSKQSGTENPQQ